MIATEELLNCRIAVVGSGAMGCYYGGRLANQGHDVHFLMRSDYEHVKRHGLKVQSQDGDFHLQDVNAYKSTSEIGPVDLVIIALKTTSNDLLLDLLPPLLKEDTMLLTLQNGLGSDAFLADHFGGQRVMGGLCFVCINRVSPGEITHIGEGRIGLGEYDSGDSAKGLPQVRTHQIARAFQDSRITCSVVDNLAEERWRKLVWNIPFNGLSIAAGGIDTSKILADEDLLLLTQNLMREVIGIAEKLGHEIPLSFATKMVEVTGPMGQYRPSSMIDFLEGREVEVESIWGEPYRQGVAVGTEVGRLETLYHLLRAKSRMAVSVS